MGHRANGIIIENGRRRVYCTHGGAQSMEYIVFEGLEAAMARIIEWEIGDEAEGENGEWWLDNAFAEAACCIDLDNRKLIFYFSTDVSYEIIWLETYIKLLKYIWPGWDIVWAWGELGEIARYCGISGKKLEEIDCKFHDDYNLDCVFECLFEYEDQADTTLSFRKDGMARIGMIDLSEPDYLLDDRQKLEQALSKLTKDTLVAEILPFAGLHIDYDAKEIHCWRTWGNERDLEAPQWPEWQVFDYKADYRSFLAALDGVLKVEKSLELEYVERLGRHLGDSGDLTFEEIKRAYLSEFGASVIVPVFDSDGAMSSGEENWLEIPGYTPPTINTAEELQPCCADVLAEVRGETVARVCAAYDLRYDCWDFDMPILVVTSNHCIDVINSKFDYVSIGIDRISPELKTNWTWWDGDDWIREYRDYPVDLVLKKPILDIRPWLEGDQKYANYGLLCGVEITLGDVTLKIANGLDTNMLITGNAEGMIIKEYIEHWKE